MLLRRAALMAASSLACACSSAASAPDASRPNSCANDGSRVPVAADEVLTQGLGGTTIDVAELLRIVAGRHDAVLTWASQPADLLLSTAGTVTTLDLEVAPHQDDLTLEYPAKSPLAQSICTGTLEIPALVTLATADGALHDSQEVTLQTTSPLGAELVTELPATRGGSLTVAYTGAERWDTQVLYLVAELSAGTAAGSIRFWGTRTGDGGATVMTPIADWPASAAADAATGP